MCNKYIYLLCGFQSTNSDRFSGDSYEGPPVPISNTVVKLVNAESTWLETAWEDRKSLIKLKGAVTKQPLKSKKLLVDYMKSTNNFFVFLSKKGPEGPFSLV